MSALSQPDPASRIDPWRAVGSGLELAGEAPQDTLPRLCKALSALGGAVDWPARFELRFERDPKGRTLVVGQVALRVRLVCQRCLGEVAVGLEGPIALALLHSEAQAEGLAEPWEAVLVGEEGIRPLDLVEDELLLAIPLVPLHAVGDCAPPPAARATSSVGAQPRDNPFAALAGLRGGGTDAGQGNDE